MTLVQDPRFTNDLLKREITQTIQEEFSKRGLTCQERYADILIDFHIIVNKKVEHLRNYEAYIPPGYMIPNWRFYPYRVRPLPYSWNMRFRQIVHTEGTLIIDVVRSADSLLIWRGSLTQHHDNTSHVTPTLVESVRTILREYPVPLR